MEGPMVNNNEDRLRAAAVDAAPIIYAIIDAMMTIMRAFMRAARRH